MKRKFAAIVAGVVTMLAWQAVVDGMLGTRASLLLREPPGGAALHGALKASGLAPGAYVVNPSIAADGRFPPGEPVYGLRFAGFGHEAAGRLVAVEPALTLLSLLVAVWLLSRASAGTQSGYLPRARFLVAVGAVSALGLFGSSYGIGGLPAADALRLAVLGLLAWTAAALVTARVLRPA